MKVMVLFRDLYSQKTSYYFERELIALLNGAFLFEKLYLSFIVIIVKSYIVVNCMEVPCMFTTGPRS